MGYRAAMNDDLVLLADGPLIDPEQLDATLGWTLKAEGLCRDDTCVIVPDRSALERDGRIDVTAVAGLLDRPAVVDDISGTAAVGAPRAVRAEARSTTCTHPTSCCLISTAHHTHSRIIGPRNDCSSRSPAGEVASSTCQVGRHCRMSSLSTTSR